MPNIYDPVYMEGYRDALIWAVSLNESCGDWLNDAIEEELERAQKENS